MRGKWMVLTVLALAAALLVLLIDVVAATGPGRLTRITTASASNRASFDPSLSADGRFVAFDSDSDLLKQGIADNQSEIWLYDTAAMTYTRVTTASAANRLSQFPSLSADGRSVAFHSDSDFLHQGIPHEQYEVWLYNTAAMTYTRVTTASAPDRNSREPSLSADGRFVAFFSDSDLLGQGIPVGQWEVWLYDKVTKAYRRVTTASAPGRESRNPSLSADGRFVAFHSDSDFLGQGIAHAQYEVWLYDNLSSTYTRVTTASAPGRESRNPSLSADSRFVAFASNSDFLSQGLPDSQAEVWLYDRVVKTYTRVTTASDANRMSYDPALSADGRFVAFLSDSDFLGQGIPNYQYEVWLFSQGYRVYLPLVLRKAS